MPTFGCDHAADGATSSVCVDGSATKYPYAFRVVATKYKCLYQMIRHLFDLVQVAPVVFLKSLWAL